MQLHIRHEDVPAERRDILGRSESYEDPSLAPSPRLGLVRRLDTISDSMEADGGPQPGH